MHSAVSTPARFTNRDTAYAVISSAGYGRSKASNAARESPCSHPSIASPRSSTGIRL